jgi:hypothetical protein
MEIVADMWEPASLFVVFGVPGAPLWGGDGLGTLDTVSGRAGQNTALGNAARNVFLSGVPKSL